MCPKADLNPLKQSIDGVLVSIENEILKVSLSFTKKLKSINHTSNCMAWVDEVTINITPHVPWLPSSF